MTNVSLSAVEAFRRCQQYYEYGWVRQLRPAVDDIAPHRGTLIHEYLEVYYRSLGEGLSPDAAHGAGLVQIDTHETELKLAASLYHQAGRTEDALIYAGLLNDVTDLARRYFNIHGRLDAERYEILLVEEPLRMAIVTGIVSNGRCDLLTRDRSTGIVWLWEHKSTQQVPEAHIRLWDLQTLLYVTKIQRTLNIKVDGVLWNYIRTKPPMIPALLKSKARASLTRRADLDTNWETYERTLQRHNIDPREYTEVRDRLLPREAEVYFPRYEHVIVADIDLMLHDYAVTSTQIRRSRWEWEHGRSRPVRSLGRHCGWCRYVRLCEANLMGGDEEGLIKRLFKVSEGSFPTEGPRNPALAEGRALEVGDDEPSDDYADQGY